MVVSTRKPPLSREEAMEIAERHVQRRLERQSDRLISKARVSLEGDARARFRDVAEKRLHAAQTAIRLLGNMAGGNTFDIWLSDVENIDRHLRGELDIAMAKLKGEKPSIGSMVWDT